MYDMKEKDKFWEMVKKDFPNDPALQEVHYARLKIHDHTEGFSKEQYIAYIKEKAKELIEIVPDQ